MKREVINTDDGSSSIYVREMDETYHSTHGAIQEARHVFLENGIHQIDASSIRLFELGFGTGLNALLTLDYANKMGIQIEYHAIEAFPIEPELVKQLNYVEMINPELKTNFEAMHLCEWNSDVQLSSNFKLQKIHSKIQNFPIENETYNVIYFDAFGPVAQAEMWTIEIVKKMYDALVDGGILVTYCAQGEFKRNLKRVGFGVETLPGPPGKREMTKGSKVTCLNSAV